jgi:hypothetical protein
MQASPRQRESIMTAMRRVHPIVRDLHLYLGLFVSPFIVLFALSVFYLVHGLPDRADPDRIQTTRTVAGVSVPAEAVRLQGRARIDALRPVLDELGVTGEVDVVRHLPRSHRLIVPVRVPGRETTVDLDYERATASISSRAQPLGDVLIYLHKTPGPHNADVRGNSRFMAAWRSLADATVYLLLFITLSGVYLWLAIRAERRVGLALLLAGAFSFFGLVYVVAR